MKLFFSWMMWVALALSAACGVASTDGIGGETHWLSPCSSGSDCGSAFQCLCGRCTEVCSEDASCEALDDRARCMLADEAPFAAQCVDAPARLCAQPDAEPGPDATTARVVSGAPYDVALDCFGPFEEAGTTHAPEDCDGAETVAVRPDGRCFWFPNTCLPDGFEETSSPGPHPCFDARHCGDDQATACHERSLDQCEDDAACELTPGSVLDEALECLHPIEGCMPAGLACPPIISVGFDEEGACVFFGNCLPSNFEAAPEGHACYDAMGTPPCAM